MPVALAPKQVYLPNLEDLPFAFSPVPLDDAAALARCQQSFLRFETWRASNCDERWLHAERLYYGHVAQRYWEGTKIPRSSVPVMKAFQVVESGVANLSQELLYQNDLLRAVPEGGAPTYYAQLVRDRINYVLDHNIDDYGWTARLEFEQALQDTCIYGNSYGLIEYDNDRQQSTLLRLDPRDVYVDPACSSPYIERSRRSIVRRVTTIEDVEAWRGATGFRIPPVEVLYWLAKNRQQPLRRGQVTLGAKGEYYSQSQDSYLADPEGQNLNVYVHFFRGREVWTIDNLVVIFNEVSPYKCSRLVSAPCYRVPNRHYAQSMVDVEEWIQTASTSLLNQHLDGRSLALSPPRAAKLGPTRTPSSLSWRPNALMEVQDPKNDVIVMNPSGVATEIWQDLAWLDSEGQKTTGQSGLSLAGMPGSSNANRTRGGMAMQLQGSNARLAPIAANFENYFMIPAFYKMLKVEHAHAKMKANGGGF